MRNKYMVAVVLIACIFCAAASADWTAPDANRAAYEQQYADTIDAYKTISYGAESTKVAAAKEALATLGYFPYRVSNNYQRTLETAVRLFASQLRIGGDGREITPLMQAMLADPSNLPKALSPVINISEYSWEESGSGYTAYSYGQLNRTSVRENAKVGFAGRIVSTVHSAEGTRYCTVQMEDDPEKLVYISYQPLPRTTVFQVGDVVAVFGVTQGLQSFSYSGMTEELLFVLADRVGFSTR